MGKELNIDLEFLKTRPVSYSSLREFLRSPKHYKYYLTAPRKSSPALMLGSVFDCLLLTEDKFKERFAVHPNYNLRTFDGKAMMEIFMDEHKGKTIVSKDDYEKALLMRDSVYENADAKKILDRISVVQKEYRWIDAETDIPCIGYTDGEGDNLTVEIKTAQNASQDSFMKDAYNFRYHFQTGIYKEGQGACNRMTKDNKYIVVEKDPPYGVAVYTPTPEYIAAGRKIFRQTIRDFRVCLNNGAFDSGYEYWAGISGCLTLDLPPWAKKQYYP